MQARVLVTGMGTVNSVAHDVAEFAAALQAGRCGVGRLSLWQELELPVQLAAEVRDFSWREHVARYQHVMGACCERAHKVLRNNTDSTRLSVCAAFEALVASDLLPAVDPERIGIIVAGSNLHQGYSWENFCRLREVPSYINPRYALSYPDSNQVGSLGEIFGLRGMGYSLGAASAAGNVAILQARQWLLGGMLDACLVVGASAELSPLELQAYGTIGAAAGERYAAQPERACRPFDRERDGFVWGQGSGCLVLEREDSAAPRGAVALGSVLGAGLVMDGSHLSSCRLDGEIGAMRQALADAGIGAEQVDYVNAHGTSSRMGDETECAALRAVLGARSAEIWVSSTKGLIGHAMGAASVIEAVATLAQLNAGFLHPNRNLDDPIDPVLRFVGAEAVPAACERALSNAFGIGGYNTSIVLQRGVD